MKMTGRLNAILEMILHGNCGTEQPILTEFTAKQLWLLRMIASKWTRRALAPGYPIDEANLRSSFKWLFRRRGLSQPDIILESGPRICQMTADMHLKQPLSSYLRHRRSLRSTVDLDSAEDAWMQIGARLRQSVEVNFAVINRIKELVSSDFGRDFGRYYVPFSGEWSKNYQRCGALEFLRKIVPFNSRFFDDYSSFVFNSGIFAVIYSENRVIICPQPSMVEYNEAGQLHNLKGPAIAWEDGSAYYFVNDVNIPRDEMEDLFLGEPKLSALLEVRNAEVRREFIRYAGIEAVIEGLGAEVVDIWENYQLLKLEFPSMWVTPKYLKMLNPSVGTWHLEGVPPDIKSCRDALAWRDGDPEYIMPEELT